MQFSQISVAWACRVAEGGTFRFYLNHCSHFCPMTHRDWDWAHSSERPWSLSAKYNKRFLGTDFQLHPYQILPRFVSPRKHEVDRSNREDLPDQQKLLQPLLRLHCRLPGEILGMCSELVSSQSSHTPSLWAQPRFLEPATPEERVCVSRLSEDPPTDPSCGWGTLTKKASDFCLRLAAPERPMLWIQIHQQSLDSILLVYFPLLSSENMALERMSVLHWSRCIKLSESSNVLILLFMSCLSSV